MNVFFWSFCAPLRRRRLLIFTDTSVFSLKTASDSELEYYFKVFLDGTDSQIVILIILKQNVYVQAELNKQKFSPFIGVAVSYAKKSSH